MPNNTVPFFYFKNWCNIPSETKGNKQSQSCNKGVNKRKHTHTRTNTNILALRRTQNWAIFSMRERKERPGSSQWNRPQDPELQSSGASSPPEHTTLLKLSEPQRRPAAIHVSSATNRHTEQPAIHTHNVNLYAPECNHAHMPASCAGLTFAGGSLTI